MERLGFAFVPATLSGVAESFNKKS